MLPVGYFYGSRPHQAQDIPVPAKAFGNSKAKSGLGDGYHVHRRWRRALCTLHASWIFTAERYYPVSFQTPWMRVSALMHIPKRFAYMGRLRLSIPIRAHSLYPMRFVAAVATSGARLSMDGKGAWADNTFIERFWHSLKYEEVYLRAYDTVADAKRCIYRYIDRYNSIRPHASLGCKTPDKIHSLASAEGLLKAS